MSISANSTRGQTTVRAPALSGPRALPGRQPNRPEAARPAREALAQCAGPRPLSDEMNRAAAKILRATMAGTIEWKEARSRLEELFGDEVVRRAIMDPGP